MTAIHRVGAQAIACALAAALLVLTPSTVAPSGTVSQAQEVVAARPGARVQMEGQSGGCTLGYFFESREEDDEGSDVVRRWAITAGHCVPMDGFEQVWDGDGPVADVSGVGPIGRVVYAVNRSSQDLDVALIELDDGVAINPAVCYFGGPIALDTDRREGGEYVSWAGRGLPNRARIGVADDLTGNSAYFWGAISQGDSGGPLLGEDGEALGVLRAIHFDSNHIGRGAGQAVRVDHQVAHIYHVLEIELTLLTAPLEQARENAMLDLSDCP